MTEFLLIRLFRIDPDDVTKLRKAETTLACFLALFDIYTDVNTVYTLFTSQDNLCTYNCPAVLASTLCAFIVYSLVLQAKYVYYSYNNKLYGFLSLLGYGPIVIAMDMWDEIGTNDKLYRRFFRIRWIETTQEALPAAAIQIVVLLFFSTSLADAQDVSSLIEVQRLQSTILIFISIILSLWSVGNGTRKYCAFIGKFNKPIWYYYCLALYTATDMFNRSLVLSLFFVSLLDVRTFDVYMIVVVASVVIHQIVFYVINEQRINRGEGKGTDSGKFGTLIKKNAFTFGLFISLYMILPSSVVFLRNFHVKDAKISFWVTWINGIGYIFAGILFFVLRVVFNDKLNFLYSAGLIYLVSFNLIPYILVLYGRLKQRSKAEMADMPLNKQLTINLMQMNMSPEEEREYEENNGLITDQTPKIDHHKRKAQKVKEERERMAQVKAEEIREKSAKKAKILQERQEKEREMREQKKRERELKDKAIRSKKKAEDEKVRLEFEKKEKSKAERLGRIKNRKNTNTKKDEFDTNYEPRNDDDMVSVGSNFSDFAINLNKNANKSEAKTKSNGILPIHEHKENEYAHVPNASPVPNEDNERPKWSLFGSGKKPKNETKHKKTQSSDGLKGKKGLKQSRANSDQLRESAMQKQKGLKTRVKHSESNTTSEENKKVKKLKLNRKSMSVQQKRKKKKQRSSSLTPMTKKEKEDKLKKMQKIKLKSVKSSDTPNEKQKKKTST